MFAFCAVFGTGIAPVGMSWVEQNHKLEWRWIQWIQIILVGAYFPFVPLLMPETRSTVILRRLAKKLRKERANGEAERGAIYSARSEVGKMKITELMKVSLVRPLCESPRVAPSPGQMHVRLKSIFGDCSSDLLATEPTVTFFSVWIAVAWGVLYGEVQSIPYVFRLLYGFDQGHIGLVYLSLA
jgi:hypothetical protein